MLSKNNKIIRFYKQSRPKPNYCISQPNLRHDIVLLVDASCERTDDLLRGQRKPQRAKSAHSPVNLRHGGVFTDSSQKNVSGFIGHMNLSSDKKGFPVGCQ